VHFEAGLVDIIVSDAGAGSLPLLEFTLTRLWDTQRHKELNFAGYHGMGGVQGTLDRFAEEQVAALRDSSSDVVDRVLLRLVRIPAGDFKRATRQRVYQTGVSDAEWEAVRHLADARLAIVDNDPVDGAYAELAHEALIAAWQRLRRQVQDNADFLSWLDDIKQRARDGDPLPAARIIEARRWIDTRPDDIPDPVRIFVADSQTAAEARQRELSEARELAERAARRAEVLRLVGEYERGENLGAAEATIALALGVESVLGRPSRGGELALRRAMQSDARSFIRGQQENMFEAVAFSPDGERVATGCIDGSAQVFERVRGDELAHLNHDGPVLAVTFSRDGARVATGGQDGSARVLDISTGGELGRLDHEGPVNAVAFSPDGTRVATGSRDKSARVFNADTGGELARLDHEGPVNAVAFSPDGTRVATGSRDKSARVFNADTGGELAHLDHEASVEAVAYSSDGSRIASVQEDGSARVLDPASGGDVAYLDQHGLFRLKSGNRSVTRNRA
jgi:hypothetical protein